MRRLLVEDLYPPACETEELRRKAAGAFVKEEPDASVRHNGKDSEVALSKQCTENDPYPQICPPSPS